MGLEIIMRDIHSQCQVGLKIWPLLLVDHHVSA